MNIDRRTLLQSSAAMTLLAACGEGARPIPAPAPETDTLDVTKLMADTATQLLKAYPETAASFGLDNGENADLKSKLSDRSPAGQQKIADNARATLKSLQAIDTTQLEPADALNVDVVKTVFERTVEGFDFPFGDVALLNSGWSWRPTPFVVAQNVGAFIEIPGLLDSAHKVENKDDADAYLERMIAYAGQLDGESERVTNDGARGIVLPDFLMEKTLGQLRAARDAGVENWGLVKTITARTDGMDGDYSSLAISIANDQILPALQRQIEALEAVAPGARDAAGMWAQPQGADHYSWLLKASTTTDMTPDEVHEAGLEELEALHARMDPILRDIGYTSGTVGERMTALSKDPRYQFSDGDAGRAEIMAMIEEKLEEIRALMPQAFETLVPGFLEVTRIPPEVEAGAPGAYGGAGSVDGKLPGKYWINLRTPALHSRYSLPDLTYHEAIPGHVWQGEYTFKLPLIRSLLAFNAYSEGWALYAEQIADELGVYDDFPVGRLGYLQSLAFRACRMVVDTGLHHKKWTRQQGVDFFVQRNGSNPQEVAGEVDRYCSWPGQACGYKVGHSAIVGLRDKAEAQLGDAYDFRRFNDAVGLGGGVPMTVLARVVDDYIARDRA